MPPPAMAKMALKISGANEKPEARVARAPGAEHGSDSE
jgi:hypothetical protein